METVATLFTLILLLASLLIVYQARKEAAQERDSARREAEEVRSDLRRETAALQAREEKYQQRADQLAADVREFQNDLKGLEKREARILDAEAELSARQRELNDKLESELERLSELDVSAARSELLTQLKEQARFSAAKELRRIEKASQREADRRAKEILVEALQRQTVPIVQQTAIHRVELPSEEMKGRIIGREGRNIRAFEALTGVNVIVEEGVNAVQLSSFDVARREVAAVTLQYLIDDGRIQPQRVEAAYARALANAGKRNRDAALAALESAGVAEVPLEMIEVLGTLRLRTSHGQIVLDHLVESAQIAAHVARLTGCDVEVARRAAFLHDVGKAFTHEQEGTHALLGAEYAARLGEDPLVVNAIAAHHDEVPMESLEAVIVQIADAASAARPGARRQDADEYFMRMEQLENLVAAEPGVAQAFAMAAGRELRVAVAPDSVSDAGTTALARTIAERIEKEFNFVGEIRVTVIRETRADAIAGQA